MTPAPLYDVSPSVWVDSDKSRDGSGGSRTDREANILELLDTTTELICSTGPDGRMNYVNSAWCHVMGYTADEAIGQSPIAFVPPEDRARAYDVIQRLIRGEAIAEFEAQGLKEDGSRVVFRWPSAPSFDEYWNGSIRSHDTGTSRGPASDGGQRTLCRKESTQILDVSQHGDIFR